MNLSIVLSTQPARFQAATFQGDLSANLKYIAGLGYDGVELSIRDPQQLNMPALSQLVRGLGLSVPAIGTGQAWGEEGLSFTDPQAEVRQAAIDRIKSHIPVASHFGSVIIIGLLRGVLKPGVSQVQAMEWLEDALRQCCSAASQHGIRLALEPINRYETSLVNTVPEGLELIERLGMDNFGLLLDTFHMNIEEVNLDASIRACGRHIFHFHVADSNRWHPGAGHLDFKSMLTSLDATAYQGWVSGEFLPKPSAEIAAQKSLQHLRGCS